MTRQAPQLASVDAISHAAVACSVCFESLPISRATVALAQPRWIGPGFWGSAPKVVICSLNPGSGASRNDSADLRLQGMLNRYSKDQLEIQSLFEHQRLDMPNWGRGRFLKFYCAGLGLRLDRLAFINVAWCATRGNKYPREMLENCFHRHSLPMLQVLAPDVVLLSGSGTHRFSLAITEARPESTVISMMHYAHREGAAAESNELARIRELLHERS